MVLGRAPRQLSPPSPNLHAPAGAPRPRVRGRAPSDAVSTFPLDHGLHSSLLSLLRQRSLRIPGLAVGALAAGSAALVCLIFCWQAGAKPKPVFQRIDLEPWKGK